MDVRSVDTFKPVDGCCILTKMSRGRPNGTWQTPTDFPSKLEFCHKQIEWFILPHLEWWEYDSPTILNPSVWTKIQDSHKIMFNVKHDVFVHVWDWIFTPFVLVHLGFPEQQRKKTVSCEYPHFFIKISLYSKAFKARLIRGKMENHNQNRGGEILVQAGKNHEVKIQFWVVSG